MWDAQIPASLPSAIVAYADRLAPATPPSLPCPPQDVSLLPAVHARVRLAVRLDELERKQSKVGGAPARAVSGWCAHCCMPRQHTVRGRFASRSPTVTSPAPSHPAHMCVSGQGGEVVAPDARRAAGH